MAADQVVRPRGRENVVVRSSGVHGRGLFARRDLEKGEWVVEYVGEKVSKGEGGRRTDEQWARGRVYTFELNRRFDIDGAVPGNVARFANHSCRPNCEAQNERGRAIWLVALRRIRVGEEITFDYNFPVTEEPPECRCGAPRCRGYIVGSEYAAELRAHMRQRAAQG